MSRSCGSSVQGDNFYECKSTLINNSLFSCFRKKIKNNPYIKILDSQIKDINQNNSTLHIYTGNRRLDNEEIKIKINVIDEFMNQKLLEFKFNQSATTRTLHILPGYLKVINMTYSTNRICFAVSISDGKLNIIQTFPIISMEKNKTRRYIGCIIHNITDIEPKYCDIKCLINDDELKNKYERPPVLFNRDRKYIYIDKNRVLFLENSSIPYEFAMAIGRTLFKERSIVILDKKCENILESHILNSFHVKLINEIGNVDVMKFFKENIANYIKACSKEKNGNYVIYQSDIDLDVCIYRVDYNEIDTNWLITIDVTDMYYNVVPKLIY